MKRLVVSILLLPLLLLTLPLWTLIGLFSMRRLGRVMEKTGQNLLNYEW